MPLQPDFSAFLRLLNEHRVEYLLVGGYVVAHYGYARTTDDFDVWVRPEKENAERVVAALIAFGFDVPALTPQLFEEENQIIRMGIPPQRLELMTSISGVTFEDGWRERVDTEWDGVPVHLLSLERLRENKRASGRLKDLADLDNLPPV